MHLFCKVLGQASCLVFSNVGQTAILVLERRDGVSFRFILLSLNKALSALCLHMTASLFLPEVHFPLL